MRYLKAFESYYDEDITKSVLELADSHLAYLVDKGFRVDVIYDDSGYLSLNICKIEREGENTRMLEFKWGEVSDSIIPFIDIFIEEYKYDEIEICANTTGRRRFKFGNYVHDAFLQGRFPITKHDNPKEEAPIREINLKNIKFK